MVKFCGQDVLDAYGVSAGRLQGPPRVPLRTGTKKQRAAGKRCAEKNRKWKAALQEKITALIARFGTRASMPCSFAEMCTVPWGAHEWVGYDLRQLPRNLLVGGTADQEATLAVALVAASGTTDVQITVQALRDAYQYMSDKHAEDLIASSGANEQASEPAEPAELLEQDEAAPAEPLEQDEAAPAEPLEQAEAEPAEPLEQAEAELEAPASRKSARTRKAPAWMKEFE